MNVQNVTVENAKKKGFPTFNDCAHTFFDLKKEGIGLFRIALANGGQASIRVFEDMGEDGKTGGKITVSYDAPFGQPTTRAIAFENGRSQEAKGDEYALYYGEKFQTIDDDDEWEMPVYDIDWSHITKLQTLSIRLENKTGLTCSVIPDFKANNGKSGSLDIKLHGKHGANAYLKTGADIIRGGLFAIVYDSEAPVEA